MSWRSFGCGPLESLTNWILQRPLPGLDHHAGMNELGAIASSYLALITLRFGDEDDFMPVLRRMAILERYLSKKHAAADFTTALAEGMCTFGFLAAHQGDSATAGELFSKAEPWLNGPLGDGDAGELQAFFHICRAWSEGLLTDEEWRVECIYSEALAALKPNSDPWLPLFIHHEAAKSALTYASARMPSPEGIEQHIRMDLPIPERRRDLFVWLQTQYFDHGTGERDAILRALAHLEAAEPLFAEFRTDEVAIQHLWLWSHALVHTDPIRGIDMILDAYGRALELEDFNRATTMALDALYLICQLSRSTEPRERVQECIDRAVNALVEPEVLRHIGVGIDPQKEGRIVMPLSLLSRIADG